MGLSEQCAYLLFMTTTRGGQRWLIHSTTGPIVNFLRQQIHQLSPTIDINRHNTRCRRCTTPQQGGFHSDYGILLCANNLPTRKRTEDALAHEMIHAYDHARYKVDPNNMRHQACTEIRASMLSGECRFTQEFFARGQWKIASQMQECVRRRAVKSLLARPVIQQSKDPEKRAEKEVDAVWESCFVDTRPFDEIFR